MSTQVAAEVVHLDENTIAVPSDRGVPAVPDDLYEGMTVPLDPDLRRRTTIDGDLIADATGGDVQVGDLDEARPRGVYHSDLKFGEVLDDPRIPDGWKVVRRLGEDEAHEVYTEWAVHFDGSMPMELDVREGLISDVAKRMRALGERFIRGAKSLEAIDPSPWYGVRFLVVPMPSYTPDGPNFGLDLAQAQRAASIRNRRAMRSGNLRWAVVTVECDHVGIQMVPVESLPDDPAAVPCEPVATFDGYGDAYREACRLDEETGVDHVVVAG